MSTFGLIAGGILKGIGDAKQQEAADARALAIEDLRERRRMAELQTRRVWEIEDRDYTNDRADARDEKQAKAQAARDDRTDARATERDDRLDARAAARDASMERRMGGRDGEGKPPADVQSATWLAGIQEKADAGDKGAQRTLAAYERVSQSKGDSPAEQRAKRAKLIVDTANSLSDDPDYQGKTYAERRAAAEAIADDLLTPAEPPAAPKINLPSPGGGGMMRLPETSASSGLTNSRVQQAIAPPTAQPATQANSPSAGAGTPRYVPPAAIDALRQNPDRAGEFDTKFGVGASKRYLGQ